MFRFRPSWNSSIERWIPQADNLYLSVETSIISSRNVTKCLHYCGDYNKNWFDLMMKKPKRNFYFFHKSRNKKSWRKNYAQGCTHFYKNIKIDDVKYVSKNSIPSSAAPAETSFLLPFCFSSIPPPTSRNPLWEFLIVHSGMLAGRRSFGFWERCKKCRVQTLGEQ